MIQWSLEKIRSVKLTKEKSKRWNIFIEFQFQFHWNIHRFCFYLLWCVEQLNVLLGTNVTKLRKIVSNYHWFLFNCKFSTSSEEDRDKSYLYYFLGDKAHCKNPLYDKALDGNEEHNPILIQFWGLPLKVIGEYWQCLTLWRYLVSNKTAIL